MMGEFKRYHPAVNFVYFLFIIGYSVFFTHPAYLAVSLFFGAAYSAAAGKKPVYALFIIIAAAVINPAFSHEGRTILGYLPGGNPLTLESVIYGLAAGVMLAAAVCWFAFLSEVMTSDKLIYLSGRVFPSLSLVLSMTLRLVPDFAYRARAILDAQKCLGRDVSEGNIIKRAKCGIAVLSAMITWSLENSIETADSMRSRGYGLAGRTAFSVFRSAHRDKAAMLVIISLGIYIFAGAAAGVTAFRYFPDISGADISFFGAGVFAAFFLLAAFPAAVELREVIRWRYIMSKM